MKLSTCFLGILLFALTTHAQQRKTWVGVNTNWQDAVNWIPAGVPVTNDSVFINAGAANYPLLNSLEVQQYLPGTPSAVANTCQYLYMAAGSQVNFLPGSFMDVRDDAAISGIINLSGGTFNVSDNIQVFSSTVASFTGAAINADNIRIGWGGLPLFYFMQTTFTNCQLNGCVDISPSAVSLMNCTFNGSLFTQGYSGYNNCTVNLEKKFCGGNYVCYLPLGGGGGFPGEVKLNFQNYSPQDDSVYIFPTLSQVNHNIKGNIIFNTTNKCGIMVIGNGHGIGPVMDSIIITGNLTIADKGNIVFQNPYRVTGSITLNGGRIIRTYPGAVDTLPPNDTLYCRYNFGKARLNLANGKAYLANVIKADSIINYDDSHYLVTLPGGGLTKSISKYTGPSVFPVGISSSYNPLFLSDTSNSLIDYSASVRQGVLANGTSGSPFTTKVVDRTWDISKLTSVNSSATITLQWNAADELPQFIRNNSSISHYYGGLWQSGPFSIAGGTGPYQQTLSGLNSFSPFAVGSSGVLPLQCQDFSVQKLKESALLSWKVSADNKLYSFVVQKSDDGINFNTIYISPAAIISSGKLYSFEDRFLNPGVCYYRLMEKNINGSFVQLCSVLSLNAGKVKPAAALAGNPVTGNALIKITGIAKEEYAVISVSDAGGKIMLYKSMRLKQGYNLVNLETAALPGGVYFIRINGNDINARLLMLKK